MPDLDLDQVQAANPLTAAAADLLYTVRGGVDGALLCQEIGRTDTTVPLLDGSRNFVGVWAGNSVLTDDDLFGLTTISATQPLLLFDEDDYFSYDRVADSFKLVIGTTLHVEIDNGDANFQDLDIHTTGDYKVSGAILGKEYIGQNLQTGTSYEFVLGDAGNVVDLSNAAAIALTIPANSAVAFPVDTRIDLVQSGAGLVTVGITTDDLRGDAVSNGQWKAMSLWKRAATEWVIIGGTTA